MEGFAACFAELDDPYAGNAVRHTMLEMLDRLGHGAENLTVLRHMPLNLLRMERSSAMPRSARRSGSRSWLRSEMRLSWRACRRPTTLALAPAILLQYPQ